MFRKRAGEKKARRKEPDSPGVQSQILHLIDCVTLSKFLHLSGSPSGSSVTQGEVDQMVKPDFPFIHPVFS